MKVTERRIALLLSVAVVLLTLLPYLLAVRLTNPGSVFSGFLINPLDGFSYLAKMKQGMDGALLFRLAYTTDPGPPALLFTYYLLLGKLAAVLKLSNLMVFHAARLIAASAMFYLAYLVFERLLGSRRARWMAYALTLIGSGLGWLGSAFGLNGSDLLIPESIPFTSAFTNAHFPLAIAMLLLGLLAVLNDQTARRWRILAAGLAGFSMGMVQPFVVISLGLAIAAWLSWELILQRGRPTPELRRRIGVLAVMLLLAAPWLIYDWWLTREHALLAVWSMQNQTPSPEPHVYLIGYGLVLLLAVGGAWRAPAGQERRFLLTWVLVNLLLLYAPFSLQRRFSMGLFLPLAALAGWGLARSALKGRRFYAAALLVLLLSLPSNLMVAGAGLWAVANDAPELLLGSDEKAVYTWLAEHAEPGSIVLSAPRGGNRLPTFATVRVLYGHPFETPFADAERRQVERWYAGESSPGEILEALRQRQVDYVLYGIEERQLGEAAWREQLEVVYQSGEHIVYRMPDR